MTDLDAARDQAAVGEQVLLTTLMVKLAVVAVLATMLVRFPWFRRILLTEKRDWPERLVFAASLGLPLTAGVVARLLLNYNAADLTLAGLVPRRPARRARTPARSSASWSASRRSSPASGSRCPFAVGCGFAGGGLREICPKEAIWHFSPLFFTDLHRNVWRLVRRFEIDWVVDPARRADRRSRSSRQALGHRFGHDTAHLLPRAAARAWLCALVVLATVLCVAIPIKIWNSARIEHRLQEQEKLLMAARARGARQPDQPALPVQHADVDLVADPLAAGDGAHADRQAVGAAPPAAAQPGALRHAARGARGDRRVPRHREHPLRPASCRSRSTSTRRQPRRRRAQHAAAAARRELDQARPVAEGRRRAHHHPQPAQNGHAIIDVIDNGVGVDPDDADRVKGGAASACATSTSGCASSTAPTTSCSSTACPAKARARAS